MNSDIVYSYISTFNMLFVFYTNKKKNELDVINTSLPLYEE